MPLWFRPPSPRRASLPPGPPTPWPLPARLYGNRVYGTEYGDNDRDAGGKLPEAGLAAVSTVSAISWRFWGMELERQGAAGCEVGADCVLFIEHIVNEDRMAAQ